MSASSSSSCSSIEEEESISFAETAPEQISNPYEMSFDDSTTQAEAEADEPNEQQEQTEADDAADEYESDYEFDGSAGDSQTNGGAEFTQQQSEPAQQLNQEFRALMLAQPASSSPRKSEASGANAASFDAPPLAPLVRAPVEFANQLGILDPRSSDRDAEAAAALSRSEASPLLAHLLQRVRERSVQAEREKDRGTTCIDAERKPATAASATSTPLSGALHAAAAATPLPSAALQSLISRLRSGPPPSSKAHWALQPELLPIPVPPRPARPGRIESLQREWDERAEVGPPQKDAENCAAGLEGNAGWSEPRCRDPTAPSLSARFPANAPALQLVKAQVRMDAALTRMRTHRFQSAYRLPQPPTDLGCDFGAVELDPRTGAPLNCYDPSGVVGDAHVQPVQGVDRRASAEGFGRYKCANRDDGTHRAPWVDRVLNRLYVARTDPRTDEDVAQLALHRERQLLRSNPIRNQLDVYRGANRATFG